MLTFYFDLWDGKRVDLDEIGLELEGSEAAFEEAVKGARDMLRDAAIKRQNASKWAYQVRDEAGQTLFTVPFSMASSDRLYQETNFMRGPSISGRPKGPHLG